MIRLYDHNVGDMFISRNHRLNSWRDENIIVLVDKIPYMHGYELWFYNLTLKHHFSFTVKDFGGMSPYTSDLRFIVKRMILIEKILQHFNDEYGYSYSKKYSL